MAEKKKQSGGAEKMFPAILFFAFLMCSIVTILIGSRVYENIRTRNDNSFFTDTALAYITNKIRQNDTAGSISVRDVDGTSVLILTSGNDDNKYETWIYSDNGIMKELFTKAESGLSTESGLEIMECGDLSFSIQKEKDDSILIILISNSSGTAEARILARSEVQYD